MYDRRGMIIMTAHLAAADRSRVIWIDGTNRISERVALRSMFEARKRVFVDGLGWRLTVLDARFEIDRFDDSHARYVVLVGSAGTHLASARLLATTRATVLNTLHSDWCDVPPPVGDRIFEITRLCVSPGLPTADYRRSRHRILSAIIEFLLEQETSAVTAILDDAWLRFFLLKTDWEAAPLGPVRSINGREIGALQFTIRTSVAAATLGFGRIQMDASPFPGVESIQ